MRVLFFYLVAVVGVLKSVTAAPLTFSDGDFSNWSFSTLASEDGAGNARLDISAYGNPGPSILISTYTVAQGDRGWGIALNGDLIWNPAEQGAIYSIGMNLDVRSVTGWGDGQGLHLIVAQGGRLYGAPTSPSPTGSGTDWHKMSFGEFANASFAEMTHADRDLWDTSSHPDFSSAGSALQFGFGAYNHASKGVYRQRYDNWELTLTPALIQEKIKIETVFVGNAGNPDDGTGYGGVDHPFYIGKYEITNAQWCAFLNAKARYDDDLRLYSYDMAGDLGGIDRNGSGTVDDPYAYSAKGGDANWEQRPVNFVNYWDVVRFCNWLHNGQGNGDTESGAYTNVGNVHLCERQPDAKYFIPTDDEWYKAAYHKNDGVTGDYWAFPTGSDTTPSNVLASPDPGNNANYKGGILEYTLGPPYYTTEVGAFENSDSPYGTFDQGGNVWEWTESISMGTRRGLRGGSREAKWRDLRRVDRLDSDPIHHWGDVGFRIATAVPEPSSVLFPLIALGMSLAWRGRRRTDSAGRVCLFACVLALLPTGQAWAVAVEIETVRVDDPNNARDTRYASPGFGAVPYEYCIGKYEITAGEYCEFLNAVAATDTYRLYSSRMPGSTGCQILRAGEPGSYVYSVSPDRANRPVNFVDWGDAVRFCNWLHNGQPTGAQDLTTTEDGAYYLNGARDDNLMAVMRNPDANWFLPTEDEWYKAAYYDGAREVYYDYPTGTDTVPSNVLTDPDVGNTANFYHDAHTIGRPYWRNEVGEFENSASPSGTFDQGGNVMEWNESVVEPYRGIRGGSCGCPETSMRASYREIHYFPYSEEFSVGFRVACPIPEVVQADVTVTVPGMTGDLWLSGMPDGSTASIDDVAPAQSPVEVIGLPLAQSEYLLFRASGTVANGPSEPFAGPDGDANRHISHSGGGAENGISNVGCVLNALMGVFLGPDIPSGSPPPSTLDFSDPGARDYLAIEPELKQVFFIGDGITSDGVPQKVIIPPGATRLFIGSMDGHTWWDNRGYFRVGITAVPEPSFALFALLGATMLMWRKA